MICDTPFPSNTTLASVIIPFKPGNDSTPGAPDVSPVVVITCLASSNRGPVFSHKELAPIIKVSVIRGLLVYSIVAVSKNRVAPVPYVLTEPLGQKGCTANRP